VAWPFNRFRALPDWLISHLIDLFSGLERAIPRIAAIDPFINHCAPDAVILSPLVRGASRQSDVLANARALEELAQTKPEPVAAIPRHIVALRLVLILFALPALPDRVRKLARRRRKPMSARAVKARTVT
jgi:hypothetical protein